MEYDQSPFPHALTESDQRLCVYAAEDMLNNSAHRDAVNRDIRNAGLSVVGISWLEKGCSGRSADLWYVGMWEARWLVVAQIWLELVGCECAQLRYP